MTNSKPIIWILGEGGLLGSNLKNRVLSSDTFQSYTPHQKLTFSHFSWRNPVELNSQFREAIRHFKLEVAKAPEWNIAWCAGAGVVGTSKESLEQETENWKSFLKNLSESELPLLTKPGKIFLASSAGGIYAGSHLFPITESSIPAPISDYGIQKLAQEHHLQKWVRRHANVKYLIAQISNLYGPGQNLKKPQGLISQLCRAALLKRPAQIYVPLDTIRDYLFVEDAAREILTLLTQLEKSELKILASEDPISISQLLTQISRLIPNQAQVLFPAKSISALQPRVLSFQSNTASLNKRTSLSDGIHRLITHLKILYSSGKLE